MPLARFVCRPLRVDGTENLPGLQGSMIFAANHTSHFDGIAFLAAVPARFRARMAIAAAADVLFESRLAGLASSLFFGAMAMERRETPRTSIRTALGILDGGWSLLIFPEGRCSQDGRLMAFKPGVDLLARNAEAAVVPVNISGSRDVLPIDRRWPRRRPVTVRFGQALQHDGGERDAFVERIHQAVASLEGADSEADGEAPASSPWSRT